MNNLTIARIADLQVDNDCDKAAVSEAESALTSPDGEIPPIKIDSQNRVIEGGAIALAARNLGIEAIAAIISPDTVPLDISELVTAKETTQTDIATATLFDANGQPRTFCIEKIKSDSVVVGGRSYSLTDVELNDVAIGCLSEEQVISLINGEANLSEEAALQAYQAASTALFRAYKAGKALAVKRAETKKGGWEPWLKKNCPRISPRTAGDWMQIAKHWEDIKIAATHRGYDLGKLSISSALKLLPTRQKPGEQASSLNAESEPAEASNSDTPLAAPVTPANTLTKREPTVDEICTAFSLTLPNLPAARTYWAARKTLEAIAPKIVELPQEDLLNLREEVRSLSEQIEQLTAGIVYEQAS